MHSQRGAVGIDQHAGRIDEDHTGREARHQLFEMAKCWRTRLLDEMIRHGASRLEERVRSSMATLAYDKSTNAAVTRRSSSRPLFRTRDERPGRTSVDAV